MPSIAKALIYRSIYIRSIHGSGLEVRPCPLCGARGETIEIGDQESVKRIGDKEHRDARQQSARLHQVFATSGKELMSIDCCIRS